MQVHLLIDSPFYTERIIKKMRRFEPSSKLFVTIRSHDEVLIQDGDKKSRLSLRSLGGWLRTQEITSVYIHFLSSSIAYVLHKTQLIKLPTHWIMWGADFYGLPDYSNNYYLPKSLPFAWKNNTWRHRLAGFLGMPSSKSVYKILDQIDYFVGYEEEFKLTQKAMGHQMKFVPWEYYFSIEELNKPEINQGGGAILLGNSDDPMNNHLDVLEQLEPMIEEGQRIIIPVAGASDTYLKALRQVQSKSKANMVLIEEQKSVETFFGMLDEVSYVVYGHLRQQGVGTILPLLYQGKKAFFWKANPLSMILERWGLKVYYIDEITSADFKQLSEEEVLDQRRSMDSILSSEADDRRWKKILGDKK